MVEVGMAIEMEMVDGSTDLPEGVAASLGTALELLLPVLLTLLSSYLVEMVQEIHSFLKNYLLVLLLQLPQCLLLHLLARIWPESYHDAIMARVKFIISRKSTCKHRRACCRASWWTSPSCWSRPSRPGLPSSCCFSPSRKCFMLDTEINTGQNT